MLDDVLNDIPMPQSVSDVTQDIDIGSLPDWNECDNLPKISTMRIRFIMVLMISAV